ncbi:hypothetical protein B0H19DRAFT_1376256 [Mycena capillaripes]|nr:hypothetical protein B0H19DRAFT_1376256 [Mycena capillaripes]
MSTKTQFPRIAIVDVPGKGKGVVAKERIARGTLIVSEKPRIIVPTSGEVRILRAISALSEEDISFIMSFPRAGPEENPITSRMKHFIPCVGDDTRGLCPTICRVNHTCYSPMGTPNATYFWNTSSKEEELYAIEEIQDGQEIEVSYMPNASGFERPLERLRRSYGFECSCPGCTRPAADRLASERHIASYNEFVESLPLRFGRDDPHHILKDIETHILAICAEGWTGEVGARAHDAFQLCAYYGDAGSAQKWEAIARDSHALYQGPRSEEFKKAKGLAAKPESFRAWKQLGRRNLKGPSKEVLEAFYPARVEPVSLVLNVAPTSGATISIPGDAQAISTTLAGADAVSASSTGQKLSKGQKKKAKAKAKKEAGKNAEVGSTE